MNDIHPIIDSKLISISNNLHFKIRNAEIKIESSDNGLHRVSYFENDKPVKILCDNYTVGQCKDALEAIYNLIQVL